MEGSECLETLGTEMGAVHKLQALHHQERHQTKPGCNAKLQLVFNECCLNYSILIALQKGEQRDII